jgi:transposase-like protein
MTKSEAKPTIAAVNELFSKSPDGLREIVRAVMQEMLEAEMTDALGAEKGERTESRLGYRCGYYTRTLVTRVGKLELRVPQDRNGRFSTELFERYQRSEQALVATLAEMYVQGVSTRKVKAITEELCGHFLLGLGHLRHQQAPGREPRRLCQPPPRRALPLPHPGRAL